MKSNQLVVEGKGGALTVTNHEHPPIPNVAEFVQMRDALAELCGILCPELYGAPADYAALVKRATELVEKERHPIHVYHHDYQSALAASESEPLITKPWDGKPLEEGHISAKWNDAAKADIPKELIRAKELVMRQTGYEIPENVRELQRRGLADANGNAIAVTRQQIADEPVSVQKLSIPKECIEFSAEGKSYDWQYEALSDEPTIIKPK